MNPKMFCYQCEQTAGCSGCTGARGVCGKDAHVAALQDQLTGALIGLARASDGHEVTESTHRVMLEGLFTTITNVCFDAQVVQRQIDAVHAEKES